MKYSRVFLIVILILCMFGTPYVLTYTYRENRVRERERTNVANERSGVTLAAIWKCWSNISFQLDSAILLSTRCRWRHWRRAGTVPREKRQRHGQALMPSPSNIQLLSLCYISTIQLPPNISPSHSVASMFAIYLSLF